ncbi:MAG: DUF3617 domain-containing protein [Burkholderiales bacterium]|nr:DUF3617 domain-containing protein [Burkholderiales bacterium]
MRMIAASILSFSIFGLSAGAMAAEQMKPGLWEMTMKSDAIKAMPKMSPQQMEQMKKMGVNVPQMQDGAMVHKVCISKEMAARGDQPPMERREAGCTAKNFQRSGNGFSVDIVCDTPQMKGTGTSKGTATGDTMSSTYDFKGTAHGRPINQHHETSGKWLSADCGSVKSADAMMPKK